MPTLPRAYNPSYHAKHFSILQIFIKKSKICVHSEFIIVTQSILNYEKLTF